MKMLWDDGLRLDVPTGAAQTFSNEYEQETQNDKFALMSYKEAERPLSSKLSGATAG
jgi:hypothetical protein